MALRLTKVASVFGAIALLTASACSEGDSSGGDGDGDAGDGDGDMGDGDMGDGDMGDGDMGDGDMGDGDMGDGDGDGPAGEIHYAFDSDVEGFVVAYEDGFGDSGEGGAGGAPSFATSLDHVDDDGNPDDGALEITIPFTKMADDPPQKSQIGLILDPAEDLTDLTVTALIKLVSGLSDAECPGGAKMFAKSGTVWADGGWFNLEEGTWVEVSIDVSSPSYDDGIATDEITEIGIEFVTGETCDTSTAVILVDSISY